MKLKFYDPRIILAFKKKLIGKCIVIKIFSDYYMDLIITLLNNEQI